MSMLACLGPTSEAVREMFLCRLQANTEVSNKGAQGLCIETSFGT